eukprot:8454181-Pyramimonas_sp.AAC.1
MSAKKTRQAFEGTPDDLLPALGAAFSEGPAILKFRTNLTVGAKDNDLVQKNVDVLCSLPSNTP